MALTCEIARRHRGVEIFAADLRPARQNARGGNGIAVPCRVQHDLDALRVRTPRQRQHGQRFLQRKPARKTVLERERVLNVAQARLARCVRPRTHQTLTGPCVRCAQTTQPAFGFLPE